MYASIVAMFGWIIPAPLAQPSRRTVLPAQPATRRRPFRPRVGGHDGAGEAIEGLPQSAWWPAVKAGTALQDALDPQRHADDAGGADQHLLWSAADHSARLPAPSPAPRPCPPGPWRSWRFAN